MHRGWKTSQSKMTHSINTVDRNLNLLELEFFKIQKKTYWSDKKRNNRYQNSNNINRQNVQMLPRMRKEIVLVPANINIMNVEN